MSTELTKPFITKLNQITTSTFDDFLEAATVALYGDIRSILQAASMDFRNQKQLITQIAPNLRLLTLPMAVRALDEVNRYCEAYTKQLDIQSQPKKTTKKTDE